MNTHENLSSHQAIPLGSDRAFGLVFTVFFTLVSGWFWWKDLSWEIPAGLATLFLSLSFVFPRLLHPLNWLWFQFGLLLHKIVSPLILGFIFYGVVAPIGCWMRLTQKDLLRLRWDKKANSYWQERSEPLEPESFKRQF